jgi:hypothetical protein
MMKLDSPITKKIKKYQSNVVGGASGRSNKKKRSLALLDFSSDLIKLNKQMLQKHLAPQINSSKNL